MTQHIVTIGNGVTTIDAGAFENCDNLVNVNYTGTMEQWNAITKASSWDSLAGDYTICCTDGNIIKA